MNRFIKFLLVAAISFFLGIAATLSWFNIKEKPEISSIQAISSNNTTGRKSFFSKKEVSTTPALEVSAPVKEETLDNSTINYFSLQKQARKMSEEVSTEVIKKFERKNLQDKRFESLKEEVLSKLHQNYLEKKNWFKSTVYLDDKGKDKIIFFANYAFRQPKLPNKKPLLEDYDFSLAIYSFVNEQWYEVNMSSTLDYTFWRKDISYIVAYAETITALSTKTGILRIMLPDPNFDSDTIYFLKSIGPNFVWSEESHFEWIATTQKEASKFQEDIRKDQDR